MLNAPELRYLPVFLAVCEEGGFHRAAEELELSQSSVSYQIRKLETLLGVELFERAGRTVILTGQGELLRDYCRRLSRDLAAVRMAIREGDGSVAETLSIASVSGFGRYVLFPTLTKHFDRTRIDLRFPTQKEVVQLVSAGVCDLGVLYEEKISSMLASVRLQREELVLIHAPQRGFRYGSLGDIGSHPFVTWEEYEYVFGKWFDAVFGRQPASVTSISHFEELEEVVESVRLDRGISIVPDHCVNHLASSGEIVIARPPKRRRCWNDLFLIHRAGGWLSEDAKRVIELLTRK